MIKWLAPIVLAAGLGFATHSAILSYAPGIIMDRATEMLSKRGMKTHEFTLGERMTPQTQSVVRPSPDLAYSVCLFDLSSAPEGIEVKMAAYEDYSSLSFFDAETNNFQTVRGDGEKRDVHLLPPDSENGSANAITSPSETGIILIRRLAPTQQAYDQVVEIAKGDSCAAIAPAIAAP